MTHFEILEAPENIKDEIRQQKKWETSYLSVVAKADLFRLVMTGIKSDEHKAYAILCYLTGARRGEVAFLRRSNFTQDSINYKDKVWKILLIRLYNEKSKTIKEKYMPLVYGIEPTEDLLLDFLDSYLKNFKDTDRLFHQVSLHSYNHWTKGAVIQAQYKKPAWKPDEYAIVRFPLFPHYCRHCRLTHFASLGSDVIISIAGWSSKQLGKHIGTLLDTYVRRAWQTIAKRRIEENV